MKTGLCDREDYVETKKLSRNKEEQLDQQGNTGSEREQGNQSERQVEKDESGIVFDRDALMDKKNDWPGVLKNCRDKKRLSRRRLAEWKPEATQGKKTWTDATGNKPSENTEARRAQELARSP